MFYIFPYRVLGHIGHSPSLQISHRDDPVAVNGRGVLLTTPCTHLDTPEIGLDFPVLGTSYPKQSAKSPASLDWVAH